jgi:uncharacterized protein (DUF924 family)
MHFQQVINFWFSEDSFRNWFSKNRSFDELVRNDFFKLWQSACKGELYMWRQEPKGQLAEIIVLDQFSRNLNRCSALAYQQDTLALALSQELVFNGSWHELRQTEQAVALLPWMHSESAPIHREALKLYAAVGIREFTEYEIKHRGVITQFGRFPHRNSALGRTSTKQEKEWLKTNEDF